MSYYIVLSENSYGEIPDINLPNFRSFNVKIQNIFKSIRKAEKYKEKLEKEHNLDFIIVKCDLNL